MRTASYSGVAIGILNAATPMTNDNREKTRSDRDAPSESPNLPETTAPKAKKPTTVVSLSAHLRSSVSAESVLAVGQ